MSDRPEPTLTDVDARAIIENEGIGYAVMHYVSGDEFQNPVTRALWRSANNALVALKEHLKLEGI